MQAYTSLFQICLVLFCAVGLVFLTRPLLALVNFLFFRSVFSVAAYLQTPGFLGFPFFTPALVLLGLQSFVCLMKSRVKIRIQGVMSVYFLFAGLCALISVLFVATGASLSLNAAEVLKFIFPLFAYILVYAGLKNEEDLAKMTKLFALISLIPILSGVAETFLGVSYSYISDGFEAGRRPTGTIVDPNLYGIYLSLCLFLFLPRVLREKPKAWEKLYLLLVLATIVVARNRGTWIALALSFSGAVYFFRQHVHMKKWILSGVLLAVLASPIIAARFAELNEYDQWGQKQDTAEGRYEYSLALLNKALESPLYGEGAGSFDIGLRNGGNQIVPPHDDYVRIACEYGFPALFLYLLFFYLQFRWTLKQRRSALWQVQFSACAGQIYIVIISVAQNLLSDTTTYMMFMSLLAASHRAVFLPESNAQDATRQDSEPLRYPQLYRPTPISFRAKRP